MACSNRRTIPYRVVRRASSRNKFIVFETFDHKEAVNYVDRAHRHDGDNAHYSIDGRCRSGDLRRMPMPMPELPQ